MLTGVRGRAGAAHAGLDARHGRHGRARRLWRAAGVAAGIALLFYCAQREARQSSPQSDGAAMVLEGWAMLHGNLLLHGWSLSDVSFYTTELPEYMVVEAVRGMHPDVVWLCAALTYTLLVVLAAAVAYGTRPTDGRTRTIGAGIAVAVMLGPSLLAATVLLNDPDHTGTAVPVLFVLLILDRAARRWFAPVAVAAVLAWAVVGDSLVLLIGVAPLVLVCGARSFGLLALRRVPLSAAWYDLSLTFAGVAAALAGSGLSRLIAASGGFVLHAGQAKHVVASAALPPNAAATTEDFLSVFSADFFGARLDGWLLVTVIHVAFCGLVVGALVLALRRFFPGFLRGDLIAELLAAAIVINLLAYLLFYSGSGSTVREIAPVFGLGGALAGRMLGQPLARRGLEPLLAVGAAAAIAAGVPPLVAVKPAMPASASLARFLEEHHLRAGLTGYWNADSTTMDSGGRVVMRPVESNPAQGLVPYRWEIDTRLLNSRTNDVNFLVATAPGVRQSRAVTAQQAVAQFGRPHLRYYYQGYVVMVWRKNLLTRLGSRGRERHTADLR
jgi:hypothetical protein